MFDNGTTGLPRHPVALPSGSVAFLIPVECDRCRRRVFLNKLGRIPVQLCGVFEPHFPPDMSAMGFNGLDADIQIHRNLSARMAIADEAEDFQFTVAQ